MPRGVPVPIGTVRKTHQGYYEEKTQDRGWVLIHRLVVERELGRQLEPNEWVVFTHPEADRQRPQFSDLAIRVVEKTAKTVAEEQPPKPELPEEKFCPRCGETKPIRKFYIQKSGRPKSFCRDCSNSYWDPKKHSKKRRQ